MSQHLLTLIYKVFLITNLFLFISPYAYSNYPQSTSQNHPYLFETQVNPQQVEIARDQWGVPHIFAPTDAEAAYGLAWAHAEDDFETIQQMYLMTKGMYGRVKGADGAKIDYAYHLLRIDELANQHFDRDISPTFRHYLEGYCQGLNAYAQQHPKELMHKALFPITPKEVVKGYALSMCLMTGLPSALSKIMDGTIEKAQIEGTGASNAFAFSKELMADHKNLLIVNAHQPIEGFGSFYEAHMVSEEGMNIHGGVFPGSATILHGTNQHLAWAHTANNVDGLDIYKLQSHSIDDDLYLFDNEWLKLEERKITLKVKVLGGIVLPIKKKVYWSKYGAAIKTKHGVYAIRMLANMRFGAAEQWYRMGKSTNFEEFRSALDMQMIPIMNITYADQADNIFFLNHGLVPKRNPNYDWQGVVVGNTSETLWSEHDFYPLTAHPQVFNPDCQYVFNANNAPFHCTCDDSNPKPADYDTFIKVSGIGTTPNNRSVRVKELLSTDESLTVTAINAIKYDLTMPKESVFMNTLVHRLGQLDPQKYPKIAEIVNYFKGWNRSVDKDNEQAAIFVLVIDKLFSDRHIRTEGFRHDLQLSDDELAKYMLAAQKHLKKHFGTTHIKYGDLFRHRRGAKDFAIGGFPDVLGSMMGKHEKDGTLTAFRGDDLMMWVRFTADGPEFQTIKAYGNSSRPDSPHYNDQMELFLERASKKMSLNKTEIWNNATKIYSPIQSIPSVIAKP